MGNKPNFERLERGLDEALAAFDGLRSSPEEPVDGRVKSLHTMLKRIRTNAAAIRDVLDERARWPGPGK